MNPVNLGVNAGEVHSSSSLSDAHRTPSDLLDFVHLYVAWMLLVAFLNFEVKSLVFETVICGTMRSLTWHVNTVDRPGRNRSLYIPISICLGCS